MIDIDNAVSCCLWTFLKRPDFIISVLVLILSTCDFRDWQVWPRSVRQEERSRPQVLLTPPHCVLTDFQCGCVGECSVCPRIRRPAYRLCSYQRGCRGMLRDQSAQHLRNSCRSRSKWNCPWGKPNSSTHFKDLLVCRWICSYGQLHSWTHMVRTNL